MSSVQPLMRSTKGQPGRVALVASAAHKVGATCRLVRKVEAMRFVHDHTSVPVASIVELQLGEREGGEAWSVME